MTDKVTVYLVEEFTEDLEGNLQMPYRRAVVATSATQAFQIVQNITPDRYWAFAPSELMETIPDILWEAADGSMIKYEVRSLPL